MSAFSLIDLQVALFELLSTDPVLVAKGFAVYDYVPNQTPVRYLVLGDDKATPFDTKTSLGMTIETEIHSWCRADGKKELKEAMTRVYDLLHEQDLEVPGQQVVVGRQDYTTVVKDPDGVTYHGVQRFMFITTPS